MIAVYVPGEPAGQGRPRAWARMVGGKPRAGVYSPKNSDAWRGAARTIMQQQVGAGRNPLAGPLFVRVRFAFALPKSKHRKRHPIETETAHTSKPDVDNLLKALFDAGTGVLWLDDDQITKLVAEKVYAAQGHGPYVTIEVEELEETK